MVLVQFQQVLRTLKGEVVRNNCSASIRARPTYLTTSDWFDKSDYIYLEISYLKDVPLHAEAKGLSRFFMAIYEHIWPYMTIFGHIYIWPYMSIYIAISETYQQEIAQTLSENMFAYWEGML